MTLVLGLGGSDYAVVLADRKITGPRGYQFDPTTKLFSLVVRDAEVIGAWTGLASDGRGFHARKWLLQQLAAAAPPEHRLEPLLRRLVDRATDRFRTIHLEPSLKEFAVVLGGFVYEEAGFRPYSFDLSNVTDGDLTDAFGLQWWRQRSDVQQSAMIVAAGFTSELDEADLAPIRSLILRDSNPRPIVERGAQLIRSAARRKQGKTYISEESQSLTLYKDPSRQGEADLHSPTPVTIFPLPDHVEARGGEFGVVIMMGGEVGLTDELGMPVPVKGPEPRRDDRCPCGSGRKYKRCHGRPGATPDSTFTWGVIPLEAPASNESADGS